MDRFKKARAAPRTLAAGLLAILGATACVTSPQPLLPDDVSAALARAPMRRLETPNLRLYYPEGRREQAYRAAGRLESCATALRGAAQLHNRSSDRRMTLIMPEITLNNAFAAPPFAGYEPLSVVPTYATIDAFSLEMGLPQDPVAVACHEMSHYVQFLQMAGFPRVVNLIFGEAYSPQVGIDSWFFEGLAVHYETMLQPGIGRLAWPYWHGVFAAGVAGRRLRGGDLSALNRDFDLGNHYVVGSHFVRYLARRYGEWYLWRLIEVQGRSIFFPLWVNVRFWQAYDKSLSTLIDEFADDVAARYPVVARPPEQRVVAPVGTTARYGRAVDGTEALLVNDLDAPPRLIVRAPSGEVRLSMNLIDVAPPRQLIIGQPRVLGPPSFTGDARLLFFTALDRESTFQASRLVRVDVASGQLTVVHSDLRGGGGSISPDGASYVFSRAEGDRHDLAELNLASGVVRILARSAEGSFISLPRYSPDGRRIVATVYDGRVFRACVFDAASGQTVALLTDGSRPVHDVAWAGDDAVVFLSVEAPDVGFQVFLRDLRSGQSRRLTSAPYLAFQPQVAAGTLRFLNREGRGWTLDEVPLPQPLGPAAPSDQAAGVPDAPEGPTATSSAASGVVGLPTAEPTAQPAADAAAATAVPPPPPPSMTTLTTTSGPSPPPPPSLAPPQMMALVASDEPYQSTDHLFVPLLHGLAVTSVGRQGTAMGVILAGNDRLQFHRWMLEGVYQFTSSRPGYGGAFGYANRQLAPFRISMTGLWLNLHDVPPLPPNAPAPGPQDFTLDVRRRQANAEISRAFYGNPVFMGFTLVDDDRPGEPTLPFTRRRAAGPYFGAEFSGVESTPYAGARRSLFAALDASVFPGSWNSVGSTVTDVRGQVSTFLPLPFSPRHKLFLSGVGRAVTGLSDGQRWLQVGGGTAGTLFSRRTPDRGQPPNVVPGPLPPEVRFFEPLRGYEDYPLATDRVAIARATYQYPFIVDWGSASTLGVLPSFFLREVSLASFGVAAIDGQSNWHTAVGGALAFRWALAEAPISITYQLSRRLQDDRAFVHLLQLDAL